MSWRVSLYAAMARSLRREFGQRFAAPPPRITDGDPVGLRPSEEVWGLAQSSVRVPDHLPRSLFGTKARVGLRVLKAALRWVPANGRHTRLGGAQQVASLCDAVGTEPPAEAWPDLATDLGWARLFTHGPLAVAAERRGDELVVDASIFRGLARHPALEPLGCVAAVRFVDGQAVPAWVELEHGGRIEPGQPRWNRARLIAGCAMHTWIVVVAHLIHVHHLAAGSIATVVHNHLPAAHPLRPLLEPHVLGSLVVNHRANHSLLGPHGSVQGGYSFTHEGIVELIARSIDAFDFAQYDVPATLRDRGLLEWSEDGRFPYGEDAQTIWGAIDDHVDAYLRAHYPDDAAVADDAVVQTCFGELVGLLPRVPAHHTRADLRALISRFVFAVTAGHRMVGGLSWSFLTNPYLMPRRVYRGLTVEQSLPYREELESDVVAKWATSARSYPLRADWSHLGHDPRGRALLEGFQRGLSEAADLIDERNAARRFAFPYLHPDALDSSTAT